MTSRREFLQATLAASAVPVATGVFGADQAPGSESLALKPTPPTLRFHTAVFDHRFPDSVAFAEAMKRLGVAVHGITGDMTDLWSRDLYPLWRTAPVPVAGLTAHGALFCLERLAWDHGMRVVFRAEHQYRPDGGIDHLVCAQESVLPNVGGLATAGSQWSAHIAALIGGCAHGGRLETSSGITTHLHRTSGPTAAGPDEAWDTDQEPLFSWAIA
jgi:hypothetical protein